MSGCQWWSRMRVGLGGVVNIDLDYNEYQIFKIHESLIYIILDVLIIYSLFSYHKLI